MLKKLSKKAIVAIIATGLTLTVSVGATVAYILRKTPPIENEFTPVAVSCSVQEEFDGTTKSAVCVQNTGDISAYIRVAVAVTWVSKTDGSVYSARPTAGNDYTLTLGSSSRWVLGSDGFYYYAEAVESTAVTDILIQTLVQSGEAPEGYAFTAQILASALQAEPKTAVETAWGVIVDENGKLTVS